jgi:hypothetical protein
VSLDNVAKYYREALEMGAKMGVQPLLELWGTHPLLGPLKNGIYVTVAAGHPDASLLLDVFHLYKSGTSFTSLKQINGASLHVMHINDYPQAADPATLNDGSRIYPGDGVAPLRQILRDLRDSGFRGHFSLELFNKEYWTKSADENLKTALERFDSRQTGTRVNRWQSTGVLASSASGLRASPRRHLRRSRPPASNSAVRSIRRNSMRPTSRPRSAPTDCARHR